MDLKTLLNIEEWEKVQDEVAQLTGTAIITVDYKGIPVTKHSRRTEFCSIIRENPISRKRCFKCDSMAGLEAVRANEPFIYLCHCGIVDVAVPIVINNVYLGAVMFGQVRLANSTSLEGKVKRLMGEFNSFQPDAGDAQKHLLQLYRKLPEMEYSRIVDIATMLKSFVNYIIITSIKHRNTLLRQEYETLISKENKTQSAYNKAPSNFEENKMDIIKGIAPSIPIFSPIYPAVSYMCEDISRFVTLREMAVLCKISPSYLSKLFLKELGENFSVYQCRQKIELAKKLLHDEQKSVAQIAYALGFQDASYFVKVFKKFAMTTPASYRRKLKGQI